ncbi:MAG: hypothetical protein HYV60_03720 [Planctomycetia bacterium]|nr:hypothetical protein [Planctomycetia bacterium]
MQGVAGEINGAGGGDDYLDYGTTHAAGLTNHVPWSTPVDVVLAIGPATGTATGTRSVTNIEHVTGSSTARQRRAVRRTGARTPGRLRRCWGL